MTFKTIHDDSTARLCTAINPFTDAIQELLNDGMTDKLTIFVNTDIVALLDQFHGNNIFFQCDGTAVPSNARHATVTTYVMPTLELLLIFFQARSPLRLNLSIFTNFPVMHKIDSILAKIHPSFLPLLQ
jgi:hypothetical protein